jgi:hypothetical protein
VALAVNAMTGSYFLKLANSIIGSTTSILCNLIAFSVDYSANYPKTSKILTI